MVTRYLVKWKNYPESESNWVRKENMNCNELIEEYEKSIPKKIIATIQVNKFKSILCKKKKKIGNSFKNGYLVQWQNQQITWLSREALKQLDIIKEKQF